MRLLLCLALFFSLIACNTDTNSTNTPKIDIPETLDVTIDGVRCTIGSMRKNKKSHAAFCLAAKRLNAREDFQECLVYKDLDKAIKGIEELLLTFSDSLALYQEYLHPSTGKSASKGSFSKMKSIVRLGIEVEMLRTTNDNFLILPFLHFKTYGNVHKEDRVQLKNLAALQELKETIVVAKAKIEADNPK